MRGLSGPRVPGPRFFRASQPAYTLVDARLSWDSPDEAWSPWARTRDSMAGRANGDCLSSGGFERSTAAESIAHIRSPGKRLACFTHWANWSSSNGASS